MSRKFIITAILLFVIPVFAIMAFAGDGLVTPGGDSVKVGEKLGFKIDLEKIPAEEFGAYKISVQLSPTEPLMELDIKEDVDITVNKVNGKYSVISNDITNYKTLNFYLQCNQKIKEEVEYTVTVNVLGEFKNDQTDFSFILEPAEEETTEEDGGDGGAGGGGTADDEGDDADSYKGSSDNYLSELSVSGYELTQKFDKTRTVYFVDTGRDVDSLAVTAIPCDRAARVDIAGNNNVGAELSKIVIDVRAVNGDTRTYTIYVRHRQESPL